MKNILFCSVLALILCACGTKAPVVATAPQGPSVISSGKTLDPTKPQLTMAFTDIDKMRSVEATINFLASDELQGRDTGTAGIEAAAQFIEARFERAGIAPYFTTYRDDFQAKGLAAYNIVGVLEGQDVELKKEVVLVGAHYDHIGYGRKNLAQDSIANGANDNASGTTAILALADYFAKAKNNKRTLVFALFSAEEKGLLGSQHLAEILKKRQTNLYAMFNIEMIGVPMVDKDHLVYISGYDTSNMAERFNAYSNEKVIGFLPKAKEFNLFKRSDNYPFFRVFNVPAQTISSFDFTNFDHYHGVDDEAALMDIAHMESVIEKLIPGLEKMVNSTEREIQLKK